jgi:hypothetical protein
MDTQEFRTKARAAITNKDIPKVFEVGAMYSVHSQVLESTKGDLGVFSKFQFICWCWIGFFLLCPYFEKEPSLWFSFVMITCSFACYSFMDWAKERTRKTIEKAEAELKEMQQTLKELGM